MKNNTFFSTFLILFLFCIFSTAASSSENESRYGDYTKYTINDFQPYQFEGIVSFSDIRSSSISVSGMKIDIVSGIRLKNNRLFSTLLKDTMGREIPANAFEKGHRVRVISFRLPNGAYIGKLIELLSEKKESLQLNNPI